MPVSNQSLEIELDPAATLRAVRDDTMQAGVNRLERLERDGLQRWGQGGDVHADTLPQLACGDPVGISYSIGNLAPLYEVAGRGEPPCAEPCGPPRLSTSTLVGRPRAVW